MLWGQQSHCEVGCPHQEGHPLSRRRSELGLRAGKGSSTNFGVHPAHGRVSVQAPAIQSPRHPGPRPPATSSRSRVYPMPPLGEGPLLRHPRSQAQPQPSSVSCAAFSVTCASSRISDRMGHPSWGAAGRWAGKGNSRSKVASPLEVRPRRLEAEGRRAPGRPAPATGDPRGLSLEKVSSDLVRGAQESICADQLYVSTWLGHGAQVLVKYQLRCRREGVS